MVNMVKMVKMVKYDQIWSNMVKTKNIVKINIRGRFCTIIKRFKTNRSIDVFLKACIMPTDKIKKCKQPNKDQVKETC